MISLKWRVLLIGATLLLAGLSVAPNFIELPSFMSQKKIIFGLDIQGGLHLVMQANIDEVTSEEMVRRSVSLQDYFTSQGVSGVTVENLKQGARDSIRIQMPSSNKGTVRGLLETDWPTYLITQENDQNDLGTSSFTIWPDELNLQDLRENIVNQAIETLRNRIDALGVAEPYIAAQGSNRILIQIPGVKDEDYQRAKDLIHQTARLEFMLVIEETEELDQWIAEAEEKGKYSLQSLSYHDYVQKLNEDLRGQLKANQRVLFQKAENVETIETARIPYLLEMTDLGGNDLRNARVAQGERLEPMVSLEFNTDGARKFANLTGANVNKRMAIVLDNIVNSVPVIQTRISGGNAQITLGGGQSYEEMQVEAQSIAMALRAGALPARLEQIEERTVGPTLGADSIAKGQTAIIIGGILVLLFMAFYYRTFGLIADMALVLNMFLILSVLTAIEATLTLPGIAGIALTIGMAVDANVIIFERVKEALRKGGSLNMAVKEGYSKGLSAIFDANITTAATSVILMYFGTGPVRGFAVTLLIGIVTSLFTAIAVTKTVLDFYTSKFNQTKLTI